MLHPLRILGRWNASLVEGACERDEDAAFDLELADNPDEAAESTFRWAIVMSIVALTATSVVGELLERHGIYRVPEAAIGVLAGAAVASLPKSLNDESMLLDQRFSAEFFMVWLLPPIIFAAGYNMDVKAFFANLGPTMLLAFGGTVLSTFVVGGLVFAAGQAKLCYPLGGLASLFFGALISATDPVTVLAVFTRIGVQRDVFAIVFGESVACRAARNSTARKFGARNSARAISAASLRRPTACLRRCSTTPSRSCWRGRCSRSSTTRSTRRRC